MSADIAMTREDLALRLKGKRTYLHGTDVYDAAVECLRRRWPGIDGRCRFAFHRMATRPLTVTIGAFSAGARPPGCVAEMHVTGGPAEASAWFVERAGTVEGRYPYDEEAVVRDCTIRDMEIGMAEPPPVRPIEALVAMTKRLHNAVSRPERGRWLFVRLDLGRLLREDDARGMRVRLSSAPRAALSRADIVVRDEPLGAIYFAVGAT